MILIFSTITREILWYSIHEGGKDSLVVWNDASKECQRGEASLLYVADGYFEYEKSWRLRELVRVTGAKLYLGEMTHINYPSIIRLSIHS